MTRIILDKKFFERDVLEVAPALLGKTIVRKFKDNPTPLREIITEVEAYKGIDDLGCHASKGKTERNKVMFDEPGLIYVYLIYGMYWMLNFVTEKAGIPQAVLIRGIGKINGPGKVGRYLKLDKSFYGEDLTTSKRIWVEHAFDTSINHLQNATPKYIATPRIGIDYAGEWAKKPWRFVLQ